MAEPITISNLAVTGRVGTKDPNWQPVFITYNADFSTNASYELEFTTVNQKEVFGIPRSAFIDNGNNPSPIDVYVSSTDQFFVVPAYAAGYFTLNAALSSRIRFDSVGGATDIVTITVHNYEVPPVVWYSYGTNNQNEPKKVYGTIVEGDAIASADNNNPVYVGAKDASGNLAGFELDAANNLKVNVENASPIDVNLVSSTANSYANITTATTTVVKNAPGTLKRITFNTLVAGATVTVYDNTSATGPIVALITLATGGPSDLPFTMDFDCAFTTGLTVVTSAATDITVIYN